MDLKALYRRPSRFTAAVFHRHRYCRRCHRRTARWRRQIHFSYVGSPESFTYSWDCHISAVTVAILDVRATAPFTHVRNRRV